MNAVIPFPLHRLPKDALRSVIIQMLPSRIFGISLISKRARHLIESLEPIDTKCYSHIEVDVNNLIRITIKFHHRRLVVVLWVPPEERWGELYNPEVFLVFDLEVILRPSRWTNSRDMSVKEVINFTKSIFKCTDVVLNLKTEAYRYDLHSVYETVEDVDEIGLYSADYEHSQKALSLFKPPDLCIRAHDVQDLKIPQNIFIQNFYDFEIATPVELSLEDLLLMNSKAISIDYFDLSGNEFNRFLKLWMMGSNPNLEIINVRFLEGVIASEEMVLAGLNCQAGTEVGYFKLSHAKFKNKIRAGRDIIRRDGTKATIFFETTRNTSWFQMFVWHSACIAQETDP